MLNAIIVQKEGPFPYFTGWEVSMLLLLPSCRRLGNLQSPPSHPTCLHPTTEGLEVNSTKQDGEEKLLWKGCTTPTSLTHSRRFPEWRLWCQSHRGLTLFSHKIREAPSLVKTSTGLGHCSAQIQGILAASHTYRMKSTGSQFLSQFLISFSSLLSSSSPSPPNS